MNVHHIILPKSGRQCCNGGILTSAFMVLIEFELFGETKWILEALNLETQRLPTNSAVIVPSTGLSRPDSAFCGGAEAGTVLDHTCVRPHNDRCIRYTYSGEAALRVMRCDVMCSVCMDSKCRCRYVYSHVPLQYYCTYTCTCADICMFA